jgi:hypothetical protein
MDVLPRSSGADTRSHRRRIECFSTDHRNLGRSPLHKPDCRVMGCSGFVAPATVQAHPPPHQRGRRSTVITSSIAGPGRGRGRQGPDPVEVGGVEPPSREVSAPVSPSAADSIGSGLGALSARVPRPYPE